MTVTGERRRPIVIGIIGGIASGKSEVTRLLSARDGEILSADAIAHRVLLEPDVIESLVALFGQQILRQDVPAGTRAIDRARLGSLVFGKDEVQNANRKKLEAIVHPRIRQALKSALEELKKSETVRWVLLDAPLLIEGGWIPYCDRVLMVESPDEARQKRAMGRGWTKEQWMDRESSQLSLNEKRKHATDFVFNVGSLAHLEQQLDAWLRRISAPI